MAEYFEQNTAPEQGSNLRYLYRQLGLDQVFERLRLLEEKVSGVEVQDYPQPAVVGQPPRPDYISENEPISVDTPRPVNEWAPTKDNRADEDWDLVQDRKPPANAEDDTRIRERGDLATDEEPEEEEPAPAESSEPEQLSLFDEEGNIREQPE